MTTQNGIEISDSKSFRQYRGLSKKQRLMLEFATKRGVFAGIKSRQLFGLYGGGGWGGKSYLLRSAAFEICMDLRERGCPDKWGVLFCDTYPNLVDRHIGKFEEEFKGLGTVQETTKRGLHVKWNGEGMGGVYLRNLDAHRSRRGTEYVFGLYDELTEIPYDVFRTSRYTIRPDASGVPYCTILAATNPDGIGHAWVKETFVPEFRNEDHPFFGKGSVKPTSMFFLQALKQDNPAYEEQKEIIDSIMASIEDEDIRRARDEGSWDLYASGRFPMFRHSQGDVPIHVVGWDDLFRRWGIPEGISPQQFVRMSNDFGWQLYGSLDYGTSFDSISAYIQHLVDPDGHVWHFNQHPMVGKTLERQAEEILELEEGLEIYTRFCDPSLRARPSRDDSAKGKTRLQRFRDAGIRFKLADNDRIEGAQTCASMLFYRFSDGRLIQAPMSRFLRKESGYGVPDLIREIPGLPRDKGNPEDVDPQGGKNHWYDSWRYFCHTKFKGLAQRGRKVVAGSPAHLMQMAHAAKAKKRARMNDDF